MSDLISRKEATKALTGWDEDPKDEYVEYAISKIPDAIKIDTDGTLWLPVESVEELDKVSRVIVESGTWCKQFYMDGQPEIIRCKDCKFGQITTDGRFCKYCELDTDDEGRMNELYIDANFFCGFAERREDEVCD